MTNHERNMRHFLESDRLPVALWHTCGHLLDANRRFCEFIGYSTDEIRNGLLSWRMLTIPELLGGECRFLEEIKATGLCRPYEEVFQDRDGHPVPAIVVAARIDENSDKVIVFVQDISSVQQSSDLLTKMDERLFGFSQTIADIQFDFLPRISVEDALYKRSAEFRIYAEQLASVKQREWSEIIRLLYEGLQEMFLEQSFYKSLMERRRKVRNIDSTTADIIAKAIEASRSLSTELALSILHEGKLGPALKRLSDSMRERYGLDSSFVAGDGIEFISDEAKLLLLQAVHELLMNVAMHSDVNEAKVTISVGDRNIQLDVEDDGVGFDPNQGMDSSGGLSTIRERINRSAGQLQIFSAPGLGTRCRVVLPYILEAEKQRRSEPTQEILLQPVRATDKPIHVLLVDDHTVIRQGIIGLLKRETDLEIVGEAATGESAVELARAVQPDVVLMDVYMPGMGGIQATKLIHNEMPQVRVIGLSMLEEKEMALLMREAGAVGYLTKNGPTEALISAIRSCA